MTADFDPYLRWLGIRDPQRPPNHYRLLGLELFEGDADIIAGAADRQMAHVRTFQSGSQSQLSQQILNELAQARLCLLTPGRKVIYDDELRQRMAARPMAIAPVAPAEVPVVPTSVSGPLSPSSFSTPTAPVTVNSPATPAFLAPPEALGAIPTFDGVPAPPRPVASKGLRGQLVWIWVGMVGLLVIVLFALRPSSPSATTEATAEATAAPTTEVEPTGTAPKEPRVLQPLKPLVNHKAGIWGLALSPDGDVLVSASADRTVGVWKTVDDHHFRDLGPFQNVVQAAAISADASRIAAVSADGTGQIWDISRKEPLLTLDGDVRTVTCLAFSPDGKFVIGGDDSGTVRVWLVGTGKLHESWPLHSGDVTAVAFPTADQMVSAGVDGRVVISQASTGKIERVLEGHDGPVRAIAVMPKLERVLSAGHDGKLQWWDAENGVLLRTLTGHVGPIRAVGLCVTRSLAISAGDDKTIRFWGLVNGDELARSPEQTQRQLSVAISPDARFGYAGSADETIRKWDLWAEPKPK